MAVILRKRQLRWAGHVVRMNNDRLLKQVMYSARAQHRTKERGQATAPLQGHTERRPEELQHRRKRVGETGRRAKRMENGSAERF